MYIDFVLLEIMFYSHCFSSWFTCCWSRKIYLAFLYIILLAWWTLAIFCFPTMLEMFNMSKVQSGNKHSAPTPGQHQACVEQGSVPSAGLWGDCITSKFFLSGSPVLLFPGLVILCLSYKHELRFLTQL